MKAPVLTAYDTPLETRDDIEIAPPGPGEVKIKVIASGVCHSDLNMMSPAIMPITTSASILWERGPSSRLGRMTKRR